MIAFLDSNLIHFYFGSLLLLFVVSLWSIRRLTRRMRIVRSERG